jgi:hypothetical protein
MNQANEKIIGNLEVTCYLYLEYLMSHRKLLKSLALSEFVHCFVELVEASSKVALSFPTAAS